MTSLFIPASVESIDLAFFQLLPGLTTIAVEDGNPAYTSSNGMLFGANDAGEPTDLLLVPEGMEGNAVLPAQMASVPACVFSRCTKLSAISVASMPAGSAATSAFASQDGILYTNDLTTLVAAPAGLGARALIADGCAAIAAGAFSGNTALTTIVAPQSVASIATGADSQHPADDAAVDAPAATSGAFEPSVVAAATVVLDPEADPAVWEAAGFTSFAQTPVPGAIATPAGTGLCYTLQDDYTLAASWQGGAAPETLELPESATIDDVSYPVASIAAEGFKDQSALAQVTLPSTLQTLGASAFEGCANLTDIDLAQVRTIGERALAGTGAATIVLPASVSAIGSCAFDGLDGATVVAQGSASEVASDVLGASTAVSVYVPFAEDGAYAWPAMLPASANRLYPYGVRINPDALTLEADETANLFAEPGYLHAPGNAKVIYSYSAKTVSVDTATGDITAKRAGDVSVDVSIELPITTTRA